MPSLLPLPSDLRTIFSAGIASLATLTLLAYRDWRALGPGGFPYSVRGFLTVLYVHATIARTNTLETGIYSHPAVSAPGWSEASEAERQAVRKSYLPDSGLSTRQGQRSRARFWAVPQRERDVGKLESVSKEVREAYLAVWTELAEEYGDAVEWRLSVMEKRGQALFLKAASPPALAAKSGGEIGHVHASDCSGHVTLSFADAEEVVRKGWGEQHRFSGNLLHVGYTFLYVPRTMAEVEVYRGIIESSIKYMLTGSQ